MCRKPGVKSYLNNMKKHDVHNLNYDALMAFIGDNEIPMKMFEFPSTFDDALGGTYPNGIILNYYRFKKLHPRDQYHIILHEIGHYLRINKNGVDAINNRIAQLTKYEDFFDYLFEEEKFAEKFATTTYYAWHKEIDKSIMRFDFNNGRFIGCIKSYARHLHTELIKSGMTFFEYTTKQFKIK